MKRYVILLIVIIISLVGCSNHNPNINNSDGKTEIDADAEIQDIPEYINKDELANRSYELHFLFGQDKFSSPDELSPNVLVQFAFCHIYYENLCKMPTTGMKMRETTADEINTQILRYFGKVTTDITKSDLFDKSANKFKMWEPQYGTEIFYDSKLVKNSEGLYVCTTTFYTNSEKQDILSKTVLTAEDNGDRAIIKQLSSR